MKQIILIAHNLRSAHNVGSLLRTADGLGVQEVILTGYSPYPPLASGDPRLPHEQVKLQKLIHKTALGAEITQSWRRKIEITKVIAELKTQGFVIAAVEQTENSIIMTDYTVPEKLALIVGREVEGIEPEVISACDVALEIPMDGAKESFNVSIAAAIALYHCRYY